MQPHEHDAAAGRIEATLARMEAQDYEMLIEGAMLAASHRLNARLHRQGVTPPAQDVMHTYLLTVNEHRRLCVADDFCVKALGRIEDMRPPYVRGKQSGGEEAARQALVLLAAIRHVEPNHQETP